MASLPSTGQQVHVTLPIIRPLQRKPPPEIRDSMHEDSSQSNGWDKTDGNRTSITDASFACRGENRTTVASISTSASFACRGQRISEFDSAHPLPRATATTQDATNTRPTSVGADSRFSLAAESTVVSTTISEPSSLPWASSTPRASLIVPNILFHPVPTRLVLSHSRSSSDTNVHAQQIQARRSQYSQAGSLRNSLMSSVTVSTNQRDSIRAPPPSMVSGWAPE